MSLAEKCAVVTGSTSGIGLGIAEALARRGANVVLNSFTDKPEDHDLADRIEALGCGGKARYVRADMADAQACRQLVEKTAELFGGVDILVNNAGIQQTASLADVSRETWDAIIAVNLSAAFHTMRRALPAMAARGYGRVINIAWSRRSTRRPMWRRSTA